MLEAELQFNRPPSRVARDIAGLPPPLRPTHFSEDEGPPDTEDRIDDKDRFDSFITDRQTGFLLRGPKVIYSLRMLSSQSLKCDCFLDVPPQAAIQLLVHMAKEDPVFGFSCLADELEHRNRLTTRQGSNKIESWVGRDTRRYVPGFYWLTLLSDALAELHGIPISVVAAAAREHRVLQGGQQHLFRFYDEPDGWQHSSSVASLCASLPGVFNIEKVRPAAVAARTFLELHSVLSEWP